MGGTTWTRGMASRCGSCLSTDLSYAEDGTATCRSCGAVNRTYRDSTIQLEAVASTAVVGQADSGQPGPEPRVFPPVFPTTSKAFPTMFGKGATATGIVADSVRALRYTPPGLIAVLLGWGFAFEALGGSFAFIASPTTLLEGSILYLFLFELLTFPLLVGSAVHALGLRAEKKEIPFVKSVKTAARSYPHMLVAGFLWTGATTGLGFVAGFLLVIGLFLRQTVFVGLCLLGFVILVFGAIVSIGLSLYPAAIVLQEETAIESLRLSWHYTHGHRFTLFVAFLLLDVAFAAIVVVLLVFPAVFGTAGLMALVSAGVIPPVAALVLLGGIDAFFLLWGYSMIAAAWRHLGPPIPGEVNLPPIAPPPAVGPESPPDGRSS